MFSASSAVSDAAAPMEVSSAVQAKIAAHPLYPKLLESFVDCQKVLMADARFANLIRAGDLSFRDSSSSSPILSLSLSSGVYM